MKQGQIKTELTPTEMKEILRDTITNNVALGERGIFPTSIDITGEAGISKTAVVKQVADEMRMPFVRLNCAELTVDD